MFLPGVKAKTEYKERKAIRWAGLNKNEAIADEQFSSTTNASSRNFPLVSPRPSRAVSKTLTGTGWALKASPTKLAWVDGTSFYYDTASEGTVTASAKSIVDFNGDLCIFPDKKYYDYSSDTFDTLQGKVHMIEYGFDENGDVDYTASDKIRNRDIIPVLPSQVLQLTNDKGYTVAKVFFYDVNAKLVAYSTDIDFAQFTVPASIYYMNFDIEGTDLTVTVKITGAIYPTAGAIPDIDYATVLNNRIWAVKNDDIYACAQGDATDWTTFQVPSVATDSFNVDTGTGGNFTGIATYRNAVYAFKKDIMFKLYGDIASNFQFVKVTDIGCIDNKSICEVNNVLFYLGRGGVYAYTGGLPTLVSKDLNETYVSGSAGTDGRRYYLSLYNGTAYALYVYDTQTNIWFMEDSTQVKEFTYLDGYLYALAADNKIYKFNGGTETVTMTLITKEFTDDIINKKYTSSLNFRVDLESGSSFKVYKRLDNSSTWTLVKTYTTNDLNSFVVPVSIDRVDHFQIKMEMIGDGTLHMAERIVKAGGKQ